MDLHISNVTFGPLNAHVAGSALPNVTGYGVGLSAPRRNDQCHNKDERRGEEMTHGPGRRVGLFKSVASHTESETYEGEGQVKVKKAATAK